MRSSIILFSVKPQLTQSNPAKRVIRIPTLTQTSAMEASLQ
jgi:hypothetical protein